MQADFIQAAEAVGAVVKQFFTLAEAGEYLTRLAGDGAVSCSALPGRLRQALPDGPDAVPPAEARLCVSVAEAGIAATGSLLLDLQDQPGRAATALAPLHAVFLDPAAIVPTLADLAGRLQQGISGGRQAYLSLTSGPSRTADIERVLTIGVHGPKELHILLLEGARP